MKPIILFILVCFACGQLQMPAGAGETLRVRVVDETGRAVAGASIDIVQNGAYSTTANEDGIIEIKKLLQAGEVKFQVRSESSWESVSPTTAMLPFNAPLTLVVKGGTGALLRGRVVDQIGAPVEGATLKISFEDPDNNSRTRGKSQVVSDADGRWKFQLRSGRVGKVAARKAGYHFRGGGEVDIKRELLSVSGVPYPNPHPTATVSDIVLQKLDSTISGVVVDESGAPIQDAEVFVPARNLTVLSDKRGAFYFDALPSDKVTIYAATAKLFGEVSVSQGVRSNSTVLPETQIVLRPVVLPGRDAARALALLQESLNSERPDFAYRVGTIEAMMPIDLAAARRAIVELEQSAWAPRENWNGDAAQLKVLWREDRQNARAHWHEVAPGAAKALAENSDPFNFLAADMLRCAIVAADFAPAWSRQILEIQRAHLKKRKSQNDAPDWNEPVVHVLLAVLAARTGEPNFPAQLGAAFKVALALRDLKTGEVARHVHSSRFGDEIALGGAALVENSLPFYLENRRSEALMLAIPVIAETGDITGALRLLDILAALPNNTKEDAHRNRDAAFAHAASSIIAVLERKTQPDANDATLALALAKRIVPERANRAMLLAMRLQTPEVARALHKEIRQHTWGSFWFFGRADIAGEAGAELLKQWLQQENRALTAAGAGQENEGESVELSYLLVNEEPGRARLRLEREWARAKEFNLWPPDDIGLAMAAIDVERAVAMAHSIATWNDGLPLDPVADDHLQQSSRTQLRSIARYLALPAEVRLSRPFKNFYFSYWGTPEPLANW